MMKTDEKLFNNKNDTKIKDWMCFYSDAEDWSLAIIVFCTMLRISGGKFWFQVRVI